LLEFVGCFDPPLGFERGFVFVFALANSQILSFPWKRLVVRSQLVGLREGQYYGLDLQLINAIGQLLLTLAMGIQLHLHEQCVDAKRSQC
jgi:hypothetical protein